MDRQKRLARQKEYQREYRARMKARKRPDTDDLARALLDFIMAHHVKLPAAKKTNRVFNEAAESLISLGFDRKETFDAWDDLLTRYENGWSLLRNRTIGRIPLPDQDDPESIS